MGVIQCPSCGKQISDTVKKCPNCGFDKISSYLLQLERNKKEKYIDYSHCYEDLPDIHAQQTSKPTVTCPYCQSTNCTKISGLNRAVSIGFWGLMSKKIGKQWHCNECGSDF